MVLTLSGALDFSMIGPIKDTVLAVLGERPAVVAVDLVAVTFLGEAELALLLEAAHLAGPDTSLRIAAGAATLRKLQVTALDGHLAVYPSLQDALPAALETPLPPGDSEQ